MPEVIDFTVSTSERSSSIEVLNAPNIAPSNDKEMHVLQTQTPDPLNDISGKKAVRKGPIKIRRPSQSDLATGSAVETPKGKEQSTQSISASETSKKRKKKFKAAKDFNEPNNTGNSTKETSVLEPFFFDHEGVDQLVPLEPLPSDQTMPLSLIPTHANNNLLLPKHVTIEGAGSTTTDYSMLAALSSPTSSIASNIHFIDDEDSKGLRRYFEVEKVAKLCGRCGQQGHDTKSCNAVICMTCGAKGEHETRSCPISITCWNCGRRGHTSANCSEPHGSRHCQRCGSYEHVYNSCPTLWRIYSYMLEDERDELLIARSEKIGLAMGSGGEGYIGWERECFACGDVGHWGFDCPSRKQQNAGREPSAFSSHYADMGPFAENSYGDENLSRRAFKALRAMRKADRKGRDQAAYGQGYHVMGDTQVGRLGREKAKKVAREIAEKTHAADDDGEDWFSKRADDTKGASKKRKDKKRSRAESHDESRSSGKSKRKSYQPRSDEAAHNEVAGWFTDGGGGASSSRGQEHVSHEEREEREYLDFQRRHNGKFAPNGDFALQEPDQETNRHHMGRHRSSSPSSRKRKREHRGARDRKDEHARASSSSHHPPSININIRGASGSGSRNGSSGVATEPAQRASNNQREGGGKYRRVEETKSSLLDRLEQSRKGEEASFVFAPKYRGGYSR